MTVYLGADHAGVRLKEKIKKFLDKKKIGYEDFGSFHPKSDDDYPKFAFKVGEKVVNGKTEDRGILICGTGTGMVAAANKVKGIRAAVIYDNYSAKMSREDNDVNIACLRARAGNVDKELKVLGVWLKTGFSKAVRHKRRIGKIERYEKRRK